MVLGLFCTTFRGLLTLSRLVRGSWSDSADSSRERTLSQSVPYYSKRMCMRFVRRLSLLRVTEHGF